YWALQRCEPAEARHVVTPRLPACASLQDRPFLRHVDVRQTHPGLTEIHEQEVTLMRLARCTPQAATGALVKLISSPSVYGNDPDIEPEPELAAQLDDPEPLGRVGPVVLPTHE